MLCLQGGHTRKSNVRQKECLSVTEFLDNNFWN